MVSPTSKIGNNAVPRIEIRGMSIPAAVKLVRDLLHKNPEACIQALRKSIVMDLRHHQTIEQCQAIKVLKKLSSSELSELHSKVVERYFPDYLEIRGPGIKISSTTQFSQHGYHINEIDGPLTPEALFVMIRSIRPHATMWHRRPPEKLGPEWDKPPAKFQPTLIYSDPWPLTLMPVAVTTTTIPGPLKAPDPEPTKVSVQCDGYTLTFEIDPSLNSDEISHSDTLRKVQELIIKLNKFSTKYPVRKVIIAPPYEGSDCYSYNNDSIRLHHENFSLCSASNVVAHEMGHAIYHSLIVDPQGGGMAAEEKDSAFYKLFALSLFGKNFHLILDRFYPRNYPDTGHPNENGSEFFASAVAAFVNFPAVLSRRIQDPDTSAEMKRFGRLVYCYLRDRVFHGVFGVDGTFYPNSSDQFKRHDKFPGISFDEEFAAVTDEMIIEGLRSCMKGSCMKDKDSLTRDAARAIAEGLKDISEKFKAIAREMRDNYYADFIYMTELAILGKITK